MAKAMAMIDLQLWILHFIFSFSAEV